VILVVLYCITQEIVIKKSSNVVFSSKLDQQRQLLLKQSFGNNETVVHVSASKQWVNFQEYHKSGALNSEKLPRRLNSKEYNLYLELTTKFTDLLFKENITFIMADGTLLGSYIMHDFIPWDDDVDIMVSYKDYPKMKEVLTHRDFRKEFSYHGYHDKTDEYSVRNLNRVNVLPDEISNTSRRYHKFKAYFTKSPRIKRAPWKWPFIDIKFFKENETHIWKYDAPKGVVDPVHKLDFYPLHLRPFSDLWLPAPKNSQYLLHTKFKEFKCSSAGWDHKIERHVKKEDKVTIPCGDLKDVYPYVCRQWKQQGETMVVMETLVLDNHSIYSTTVNETYHPKYESFSPFWEFCNVTSNIMTSQKEGRSLTTTIESLASITPHYIRNYISEFY